jgi:hypothetical protein
MTHQSRSSSAQHSETADMDSEFRKKPWLGLTGHARELAKLAFTHMSQDVPLCPRSELDPSPILPEESGDELSPAQRIALAAIVSGSTFSMAARAANVDRRTVFRWRSEPAFKRVLDELNAEAHETISIRVRNLMLKTTRVLSESLGSGNVTSAIRIANSARLWSALNAGAPKSESESEEDDATKQQKREATEGKESDNAAKPQAVCPPRKVSRSAHAKIAAAVRFPLTTFPESAAISGAGGASVRL